MSYVPGVGGVTLQEDTALPTMAQVGDTVELSCNFVLDGARRGESSLYSVKWYRDNVEFFRCVMMSISLESANVKLMLENPPDHHLIIPFPLPEPMQNKRLVVLVGPILYKPYLRVLS